MILSILKHLGAPCSFYSGAMKCQYKYYFYQSSYFCLEHSSYLTFQTCNFSGMEWCSGSSDGPTSRLWSCLQRPSKWKLRLPFCIHCLFCVFHHYQLHDCDQHVHCYHPWEFQSSPPRRRNRHSWRRFGNVLWKVVQVRTAHYTKSLYICKCFYFQIWSTCNTVHHIQSNVWLHWKFGSPTWYTQT